MAHDSLDPVPFSEAVAGIDGIPKQLDDVVDDAPFGVYIDHPEDGCVYANAALLCQFGVKWSDFAGFGWARFVHPDDAAALQSRIHEYELDPGVIDVRYRVRRPAGDERWIHARVEATLDEQGRHIGSVGTTEDITELEAFRRQTTGSQKLQAVGRLAGGVAHDFNNLLAAISASAELLRLEVDDIHVEPHLETICRAVEQGRQVTQKLLLLAQDRRTGPSVCRLDTQLEGLEQLLKRALGAQLDVVVRAGAGDAFVGLDQGQFGQLLLNLASNGADAMNGRGVLHVRSSLKADDAVLDVEDGGQGMDEETQKNMFQPFFTTKGPDRGVGLGSWIVKDLVDTAGGSIEVHSAIGRGTRIRVRLPTVEPHAGLGTDRFLSDEQLRGDERVLLVEDHDGLRQSLAYGLSIYGYQVETARSVVDAEARLADGEFDAVVCDVLLIDGTAAELTRRLRPNSHRVPWIFVSGFSGSADLTEELKQPGTEFLAKPFQPRDVVSTLRRLLDRVARER